MTAAPDAILEQAFIGARTFNAFSPRPVEDETLLRLYDLMRWGPTSMNCQPGRYLFVKSTAAKEQLTAALAPGNVAKTMAAPVTAIVAFDTRFYDHLPAQFPAVADARSTFADNTPSSSANRADSTVSRLEVIAWDPASCRGRGAAAPPANGPPPRPRRAASGRAPAGPGGTPARSNDRRAW